jgi:hypothetical protein
MRKTPGFSGDEDLAESLEFSSEGSFVESPKTPGFSGDEDLAESLEFSSEGSFAESPKETRGLLEDFLIASTLPRILTT